MLAEKERALRAEQEQLKTEREQYTEDLDRFRTFQAKLRRKDALGALKDMGIGFDELSEAVLQGRGVNPTSELEEQLGGRISETEQRLAEQLKAIEERQRQADVAAFRATAAQEIARSSPVMSAWGDQALDMLYARYETMATQQQHHGEQVTLPPISKAVQDLEKETLELFSRFSQVPAVRELFIKSQPADTQDASPTLSNRQAATVPTRSLETEIDHLEPGDDLIEAITARHR